MSVSQKGKNILCLKYFKAALTSYNPQTFFIIQTLRGGGYDSTITINDLGVSDADIFDVAGSWKLKGQSVHCYNVTVTRGKNSLRIKGIIKKSDGHTYQGGAIDLYSLIVHTVKGRTYTFGYTIKDNLNTFSYPGYYSLAQNTYLYKIYKKGNEYKFTDVLLASADSSNFGCMFFIKAGTDVPFDFTVSDIFLYEGAYANPPVNIVSLECNPNNTMLNTWHWYYWNNLMGSAQFKTTKGWRRLYQLPNGISDDNTSYPEGVFSFWGTFRIFKGYNNTFYASWKVDLMYVKSYSSTAKYYINVTSDYMDNTLSKFRLVKESDHHNKVYLEAYYNFTGADYYNITLDDVDNFDDCNHSYAKAFSNINPNNNKIAKIKKTFNGLNAISNTIYSNEVAISNEVTPTNPLVNVIA